MTTKYISKAEQEKLKKLFNDGACRVQSEPEYWIHNADEGESYCHECCEKEVERLLKEDPDGEYCVDGGSGNVEGDYTPFCEKCNKRLENTLTDCGCEDEIRHFLENGFDPQDDYDCRAMSEVIGAREWEPFDITDCEKSDLLYYAGLHKLCRLISEKI